MDGYFRSIKFSFKFIQFRKFCPIFFFKLLLKRMLFSHKKVECEENDQKKETKGVDGY